ncbi:ATP-dependent RNA helicase DbpA [Marinomonas mediterranea]|uniref:DEAD/DEAH box helicase domain protein n=1 Tax=Marinomonas mediterranea (strain ATCC 700492 / JCM 21426 / NBRC 103028 / MMB-1) TaxID=717774 RepID=F2JZX8_MARM1|nr:ATP-dependent RNA helicase DbpA [Marinomonas mediterranea]ADZ92090.1 DEAD/DEAH box helicase domain protein [Marinomonas mediterranea MMB-1]WCN10052.1 ATP-dependent RNA helicase DbpA [Marinomonas mediterranea]WCN14102.1 ATP-dependent RNA helicase DbpA [Marinomonas mediterranea]WCN18158.1 ATP-dependent RNA helicase DbpA [Marinomonas mediterranea MMB-1]
MSNFSHSLPLALPSELTKLLGDMGFKGFTPVQEQCLPDILEGKDLLAQAQTGSGKTLAFAIGLLLRINPRYFSTQALIMCPTRELADQVAKEIRRVARFMNNIKVLTLCGGMPFGPQIGSLEHGAHIVVGTPGRLLEHLRKRTLSLQYLNTLVLDEADRMLDMGFVDSIREVVLETPSTRQTLLFSATYGDNIEEISNEFQNNPSQIQIEVNQDLKPDIKQFFARTEKAQKYETLLDSLAYFGPRQAIVFCNTKADTQAVADFLNEQSVSTVAIHGDLEQKQRDQVLVRFANKSACIMVATDVAARGIDVKEIDLVINFDTTRDIDVHTHRIGRTGRAGHSGQALSFITDKDDYKLKGIIERFDITPEFIDLPETPLSYSLTPEMATIAFDAGRKNKLRPGDILGALTAGIGLEKSAVGKIDIYDFQAYVAVEAQQARKVVKSLANKKIKGRTIKSRVLR